MKRTKDVKRVKDVKSVPHVPQAESRVLWGAVALCVALGALLGWRQIASPDIGFHLSTARWMLANHAWPTSDLFSFTFAGHPYIDLQWLFQLVMYGANHVGGTAMMMAVKIVVTLSFWGLLAWRARRSNGALPWSVPLLLILVGLGDFWEERPHIFSWLYGSLILLVLEEYSRGNRRWLPALPVIMLFWVNTHQLFVLGLVAAAVYVAWELRKGAKADRALLAYSLLSVAVCLANPYGVKGLLLPIRLFGEIQAGDVFAFAASGISEMQPPFTTSLYYLAGRFVLFQPPLYWHLYSLLAVVGLVSAWRRARAPELVLWFLFAFVFSQAAKNFGYFVMATFPLAAVGVDRALAGVRGLTARRATSRAKSAPLSPPTSLLWGAIALSAVLIVLVASGRLYRLAWSDFHIRSGYNSSFLPVEAAGFLRDHKLQGHVITTFGYGSYVHWITGLPVSIYGIQEVMGPEFYREYLDSLTPQGFPGFLSRWKPTIAVASFVEAPYWAFYLSQQPDWRLVHFTDNTAVYLHTSVAGPAALPESRPNVDFTPHTRDQMKRIITEAVNRPEMTLAAWFQGSEAFQQQKIRLSTFFLYSGRLEASVHTGTEGLKASPIRVTEQLLVLGNAFNAMGDYELSDLCFAGVLKGTPDSQTRQQIEAAIKARASR